MRIAGTAAGFLALLLPVRPAAAEDATVARWRAADAGTRATVLRLARRVFDAYATSRDTPEPPTRLPALLRQPAAVFVSAMRNGAPRCCMGTLYPTEPDAAHEIVASAVAASGRDRRFPPVRPSELRGLTLIVSVVGHPRAITRAQVADLDPTRDGLAVRRGDRYGVVLSGETSRLERMEAWARARAGARPDEAVEYFQLDVARFVEEGKRMIR